MNESTGNHRQLDRYDRLADAEVDQAAAWLQQLGQRPWPCRCKIDGDTVSFDTRGVPTLIRQALSDWFTALELMDAGQIRQLLDGSVGDLVSMADHVLTEAGR